MLHFAPFLMLFPCALLCYSSHGLSCPVLPSSLHPCLCTPAHRLHTLLHTLLLRPGTAMLPSARALVVGSPQWAATSLNVLLPAWDAAANCHVPPTANNHQLKTARITGVLGCVLPLHALPVTGSIGSAVQASLTLAVGSQGGPAASPEGAVRLQAVVPSLAAISFVVVSQEGHSMHSTACALGIGVALQQQGGGAWEAQSPDIVPVTWTPLVRTNRHNACISSFYCFLSHTLPAVISHCVTLFLSKLASSSGIFPDTFVTGEQSLCNSSIAANTLYPSKQGSLFSPISTLQPIFFCVFPPFSMLTSCLCQCVPLRVFLRCMREHITSGFTVVY